MRKELGFTIIELLIATSIFSAILLLCTAALVQIGRMYYKGVTGARTQETARSAMDEVSRSIQFSSNPVAENTDDTIAVTSTPGDTIRSFCVGDTRYSYVLDAQVDGSVESGRFDEANRKIRHALWRDRTTDPECRPLDLRQADPSGTAAEGTESSDGEEVLGANMRLSNLKITNLITDEVYAVDLWVAYGDSDLLDKTIVPGHTVCKGGEIGSQFCSVAELSTVVNRRVR